MTVGWGAQQFAPLLLLYRGHLDLSNATVQAIFGCYVVGLIPGLLLGGPVSDRYGRRRVMLPTLALSAAATCLLIVGGAGVGWLVVGRLVAGVASGAGFSSGAAWLRELSAAGSETGAADGPRRMTIAMSVGFGLGPMIAGGLAQWAPAPTVLPYVPHLVLAAVAFWLGLGTPESRTSNLALESQGWWRRPMAGIRHPRFVTVVVPLAPWVFASAAIALAYLPGLVEHRLSGLPLVFSALITTLTAGAGILVQPIARRIDYDSASSARLARVALMTVVGGLLVAAAAAATARPALVVVAAIVLGAAYGTCQVAGLLEVQRLADPDHLAGLTAAYQAISYLGFVAPLPLAAAAHVLAPSALLLVVAGLAALSLLWIVRSTCPPRAESRSLVVGSPGRRH